jgi:hypothetical protein
VESLAERPAFLLRFELLGGGAPHKCLDGDQVLGRTLESGGQVETGGDHGIYDLRFTIYGRRWWRSCEEPSVKPLEISFALGPELRPDAEEGADQSQGENEEAGFHSLQVQSFSKHESSHLGGAGSGLLAAMQSTHPIQPEERTRKNMRAIIN